MARTGAQRQADYMHRIRQAALAAADHAAQIAALQDRISRLERQYAAAEPTRRVRPRLTSNQGSHTP